MAPEDTPESEMRLVLYQLGELKAGADRDRKTLETRLDKMEDTFSRRLDSMSFTRRDTFDDYRAAQAKVHEDTRALAESARSIAMWALGVTVTAAIAALVGLIRLVAS